MDRFWNWRYRTCPCCCGELEDADQPPQRLPQIELADEPVQVHEHRWFAQWCPHCQKLHVPRLSEPLLRAGRVGPRLTALVGDLKGVCHMFFSGIRKYFRAESCFRFITMPDVEPTHNLAEQAIRFVAIHRRLTQGTRGETGMRWLERIATTVVTCEQQGRSILEFIGQAVDASFDRKPAPT